MLEGKKICDESKFRGSHAPVNAPDHAFAMPLRSPHEKRTILVEVRNLTAEKKDVNVELP